MEKEMGVECARPRSMRHMRVPFTCVGLESDAELDRAPGVGPGVRCSRLASL